MCNQKQYLKALAGAVGCLMVMIADVDAQRKPATQAVKTQVGVIKTPANRKAQYRGGEAKLADYFAKNLHYPNDSTRRRFTGEVTLRFAVEMDGNINELTVLKGMGKYYDAEALRLLRDSPKWEPALQNGKPVRTYVVLPVKFAPK